MPAEGDFVTAVYNPKSNRRYWQLYRLQELFLQRRAATIPVGYVREAGRDEQKVTTTTLSPTWTRRMWTCSPSSSSATPSRMSPTGSSSRPAAIIENKPAVPKKPGQQIGDAVVPYHPGRTCIARTIRSDISGRCCMLPLYTTADFDMEQISVYGRPSRRETV